LFELLEENDIETHYREMMVDYEMLMEVIIRNTAAGSITKKYPFEVGQPLQPLVIVMDYKDDARHDPMLNKDIAAVLGLATKEELADIKKTALKINKILKSYLDRKGLLLPDFKLEFGHRGDEISCDTCRLWDKETGDSLDKDVFRFNKGDLVAAYMEVARRIVPEIFE